MNIFSLGILEKIIGSVFYLFSGIIWKKILLGKLNYHVIFYRTLASIFFIFLIITLNETLGYKNNSLAALNKISFLEWVYTIALCLFSFWGLYFYTSAIQLGRYTFVTPLSGLTALFSFFISILLYNESLTFLKVSSIIVIVSSLLYHQKEKFLTVKISKELLLILLSSMFWGISFVLYLIPIKKFGVLNFSLILECCVFVSSIFLIFVKDKKLVPPKFEFRSLSLCILMGLMVAGGSVLNNFSMVEIPISLNILIGLLFEIIVLLTGIILFKERLSLDDWILIFFITIGFVMLMI